MIFTSQIFLFWFLPGILLLYYLLPFRFRSGLLVLASYLFYGWWRPDFVLLMLVSTLIDFWCGRGIGRMHALVDAAPDAAAAAPFAKRRKRFLILSMCANLGLLGYFKYWNFGIDSLNVLLEAWEVAPVEWSAIVLPVGISFYTFQSMSYSIDVFRKDAPPVARFIDFACYISLFPQLVAGPIVRYRTLADQLRNRDHTLDKFARGAFLFQVGFIKKLLIADTVAVVAAKAFEIGDPTATEAWLGAVAYTIQIYFDFSGYSDMAIGLGLMIGFRLPINFARPYTAVSITDFWRRWHISLSAFLRDYLYIPLGGNRKGPRRTYLNLLATMLLGGLWHGAQWTFVIWGAYHGAWLALERWRGRGSDEPQGVRRTFHIACTFVVVLIGWVFFRAPDISYAGRYLWALAGGEAFVGAPWLAVLRFNGLGLLVAALVVWCMPTTQERLRRFQPAFIVFLQLAFVIALLHLHYQGHVPFLYYQF